MNEFEKEVVLPEGHRYAMFGGGDDYPIKPYYEGVFEAVFVVFHPFLASVNDRAVIDRYVDMNKNEVEQQFRVVTWQEMCRQLDFDHVKRIDHALRTMIGALKPHAKDRASANRIIDFCKRDNLLPPGEGVLSNLLENQVLRALLEMGEEWMWSGDEFCTERHLIHIRETLAADTWGMQHRTFFGYQHEWLIVPPWDSHFTLFCGSRAWIGQVVERCELEGFYCDDETTINWSLSNRKLR
ncbi:DUF2711 family protein [Exiguobacterium aurantiacum]|uniref:Protein of uncharacterized function (DUF2711) n=1 Tax=Exiguobacterium aurantiacum TaxID=33987 RepID=A0A377FR17_9BACL|nr:DUF2711 family protein [Exiguobacterium aurantiacum]STO07004.1 Protein of uncharacterised function (DUF2711) [Exiguobacterium aurantiacum]